VNEYAPETVPETNTSGTGQPIKESLAATGADLTLVAVVALAVLLVGILLVVVGYRDRKKESTS
jgi:hypothetical protein